MSEQKSIWETPCKTCVFAKYKGDVQYGCAFDRIEKFQRNGIEVVECYDQQKAFYVIKTACLAHRDKKSPWAMRNAGPTRKALCRKELELNVDVVLVMEESHTIGDVKKTVDSLLAQTLLPAKVTVVLNSDNVPLQELRNVLPADWVVKVVAERTEDGGRVGRGRCIDLALIDCNSNFYALFNPGFEVPPSFLREIDVAINDELDRFLLLEPTPAGEGCVVQMRAHHYYGGNSPAVIEGEDAGEDEGKRADSIQEKIYHRVKAEGKPHFVKNVEEVCRSMRTSLPVL